MSVIKLIHLNPYNDTCFAKAGILLHLVGEIQSYAQSFKPLVVQKPLIYAEYPSKHSSILFHHSNSYRGLWINTHGIISILYTSRPTLKFTRIFFLYFHKNRSRVNSCINPLLWISLALTHLIPCDLWQKSSGGLQPS